MKWFVKKTNCGIPTYFHARRTLGSLSALRDSIKKGFAISIVSKENDVTSVSLLDNVYISSNKIYGQQVNDVLSKKLDRNRIVYESNISRVFTMFSTDNTIERSNWDLTVHRSRDYSKEYGALSWFADTRWELVYAHSKTGMPLKGSINDLRSAILTGRRIRFQLPDSTFFTTEADYLVIKNGHMTTRILRVATSNTSDGFDRKGLWEWLMVSTTGMCFNFLTREWFFFWQPWQFLSWLNVARILKVQIMRATKTQMLSYFTQNFTVWYRGKFWNCSELYLYSVKALRVSIFLALNFLNPY